MKFNSLLLYIGDNFPVLEDFQNMMKKGNSRFWKGDYLYDVEHEIIAGRFYWLYLQYDNANLYSPLVVDTTDDSVKDNPRPKNQVEMRNQLFACYDLVDGCLYISDHQKRGAITHYIADTLQCVVKAKFVHSSIDEFLNRVTQLKSVTFTQKKTLHNLYPNSLFSKVPNIYGLDLPDRSKVKLDYGNCSYRDD